MTLPNDGPDSQYVSKNTDCLLDDGMFYSGCWDVLNIVEWLPQWFKSTPQCSTLGVDPLYCNHADLLEPWTTTFLRQAAEGGSTGSVSCTDIVDECTIVTSYADGARDSRLQRARYRYVRQNIQGNHAEGYPLNLLREC